MVSSRIIVGAFVASVLWPVFDVVFHSHFRCSRILSVVNEQLAIRTHLHDYMIDHDDSGQLEAGKVTCTCNGRKVVITGKVVSESLRQEFSDVASYAVGGPERVDNQIEVLNEDALRGLSEMLGQPPTSMSVNYQVKDRGTVYLTGDLPANSGDLKKKIGELVLKIRGVRNVVNDLGKVVEVQRTLVVHNIYFDFDKWVIRDQSQSSVDEVSEKIHQYLDGNSSGSVTVEGHTDSIASDKYNQWLSEKRATAVLDALKARGIDGTRLKAVGRGESQLLVRPDDTPEKRAENRRIEFHFE